MNTNVYQEFVFVENTINFEGKPVWNHCHLFNYYLIINLSCLQKKKRKKQSVKWHYSVTISAVMLKYHVELQIVVWQTIDVFVYKEKSSFRYMRCQFVQIISIKNEIPKSGMSMKFRSLKIYDKWRRWGRQKQACLWEKINLWKIKVHFIGKKKCCCNLRSLWNCSNISRS